MKTLRAGILAGLIAGVLALALSGCAWPEANADVQELRVLHKAYRDNTVPKNPSETAQVEQLSDSIESCFEKLDRLTR